MEDEVIILYDYYDVKKQVSSNLFKYEKESKLAQKYFIIKSWSSNSLLPLTSLEKIYIDIYSEPAVPLEDKLGPFSSIDEIKKFGYKLCLEVEASKVYFLSLDDYNETMEKIHLIKDFPGVLLAKAEFLENLERQNKSNIFDRIFS